MHYEVITTRIWIGLGYFPPKYTEAAAFAVVLLAFSSIIVFMQRRMLANKSYATVTGKGFKPAVAALGRLRYVALAICILYFAVSIVLPYAALVFTSFQPYLSFAFEPSTWTLDKYAEVLNNPLTARATVNSLLLGVGGATLTIFFSLIISYVVRRTRMKARHVLDYLATLPVGVPAVVFAVALLWGYIFLPVPIYGTIWMLLIAYIAHYIPFGRLRTGANQRRAGRECPRPWRDLDRHHAENRYSSPQAGAHGRLDSAVRRVHTVAQPIHPALHAGERGHAGRHLRAL
jgi:iron(III) transport system permease protein